MSGIRFKAKANIEWTPVTLSYNLKKRFHVDADLPTMSTRFCGRNANGKYDLDVQELRSAFVANETFGERLKAFRLERINRLLSGNGPVPLAGDHLIVMHLLPVAGARSDFRLGTADPQRIRNGEHFHPLGVRNLGGGRLNFDGLLNAPNYADGYVAYAQIMRNGFIEAVDSSILEPFESIPGRGVDNTINSIEVEKQSIQDLDNYLHILNELAIHPPFVLSVSLLNVKGFPLYAGQRSRIFNVHPVDRDHLLADEVLIENADDEPAAILQPVFDQVWNACGWTRSMNYDNEGLWTGSR